MALLTRSHCDPLLTLGRLIGQPTCDSEDGLEHQRGDGGSIGMPLLQELCLVQHRNVGVHVGEVEIEIMQNGLLVGHQLRRNPDLGPRNGRHRRQCLVEIIGFLCNHRRLFPQVSDRLLDVEIWGWAWSVSSFVRRSGILL